MPAHNRRFRFLVPPGPLIRSTSPTQLVRLTRITPPILRTLITPLSCPASITTHSLSPTPARHRSNFTPPIAAAVARRPQRHNSRQLRIFPVSYSAIKPSQAHPERNALRHHPARRGKIR